MTGIFGEYGRQRNPQIWVYEMYQVEMPLGDILDKNMQEQALKAFAAP